MKDITESEFPGKLSTSQQACIWYEVSLNSIHQFHWNCDDKNKTDGQVKTTLYTYHNLCFFTFTGRNVLSCCGFVSFRDVSDLLQKGKQERFVCKYYFVSKLVFPLKYLKILKSRSLHRERRCPKNMFQATGIVIVRVIINSSKENKQTKQTAFD